MSNSSLYDVYREPGEFSMRNPMRSTPLTSSYKTPRSSSSIESWETARSRTPTPLSPHTRYNQIMRRHEIQQERQYRKTAKRVRKLAKKRNPSKFVEHNPLRKDKLKNLTRKNSAAKK